MDFPSLLTCDPRGDPSSVVAAFVPRPVPPVTVDGRFEFFGRLCGSGRRELFRPPARFFAPTHGRWWRPSRAGRRRGSGPSKHFRPSRRGRRVQSVVPIGSPISGNLRGDSRDKVLSIARTAWSYSEPIVSSAPRTAGVGRLFGQQPPVRRFASDNSSSRTEATTGRRSIWTAAPPPTAGATSDKPFRR